MTVHLRSFGATVDNLRVACQPLAHAFVGMRERRLVDLTGASWNQHQHWLRSLDQVRNSGVAG